MHLLYQAQSWCFKQVVWAEGVAQVIKFSPSKHEPWVQSWNHEINKYKKKIK
jgi:hypothetical protein